MKMLRNVTARGKTRFLSAFTLAEVLITLGIIGVVAAITIPTLVQNYQKKTYVEGLKVGMSIFEQGFKKAMADDGVTDLRDTELFRICNSGTTTDYSWAKNCQPMLKKYFIYIKFEDVAAMQAQGDTTNIITDTAKCKQLVGKTNKWWYLNDKTKCRGWRNMAVTLANGMRADFALSYNNWRCGQITALDVNGSKGPNTWGRDTFQIDILCSGILSPRFSRLDLKFQAEGTNTDYDSLLQTNHWEYVDVCSKTTTEDGSRCAARIIESGWKMDY
jgi:prepilin-type N-terminal cleavage/methylation domain-containing protein